MKKRTILLLSLLVAVLFNAYGQQYVWTYKTAFPPGNRYGAFQFSIGNNGYIGSGLVNSGGNILTANDFWEYDATGDVWSQKASLPDTPRYAATGFSIGSKGYVVNGNNYSSNLYLKQTWEYDPASNVWTAKSDFPGAARYTCSSFIINAIGYVGMGYNGSYHSDFYGYDPVNDQWSSITPIPGIPRQSAKGFTLNGKGYVVGGANIVQGDVYDLWQYDVALNSWSQKASFPGAACYGGAVIEVGGKLLVGTGSNQSGAGVTTSDFYSYDDVTNTWAYETVFAGGTRQGNSYFNIGNAAYVGLGSGGVYPIVSYQEDLWRVELIDANTITGKVFYDFNNNMVQDSGEGAIANKLIREVNTGRIAFTDVNGEYSLTVLSPGNFTLTTDSLAYFSPTPTTHNVSFTGLNEEDSLKDFAFQASSPFRDLSISITPVGFFRPGFDATYNITYSNQGTNIENPVVSMVLDTNLTYVSATEIPSSVGADTIVWTLPPINPFSSATFYVTVNISPTTPIGDTIGCPVWIEPFANDIDIYNNYSSWNQIVTGSFDPNDIQVNLTEIPIAQVSSQPWLEYLIRFQNTGNDTAFNINVVNGVPTGVELNSFELISTSHPVVLSYDPLYNTFGFKFNNILLADSNTNEPLSHGFIRYRIRPQATLQPGDVIENSAGIYFDFNAPVLTNTATTYIINPLAVQNIQPSNGVSFFPNPNNGKFNILFGSSLPGITNVSIFNVTGETVYEDLFETRNGTNKLMIDALLKVKGVYFISVKTPSKTYVQKFVVTGN